MKDTNKAMRLSPANMIDPKKVRRWVERRRHSLLLALRERDGDICLYCDKPLDGDPFEDQMSYWRDKGFPLEGERCLSCGETMPHAKGQLHIDHIIPLSKGGTNDPDNLCLLHKCCNLSKASIVGETGFAKRVREHRKGRPNMRFSKGTLWVIHDHEDERVISVYSELTSARWRD